MGDKLPLFSKSTISTHCSLDLSTFKNSSFILLNIACKVPDIVDFLKRKANPKDNYNLTVAKKTYSRGKSFFCRYYL